MTEVTRVSSESPLTIEYKSVCTKRDFAVIQILPHRSSKQPPETPKKRRHSRSGLTGLRFRDTASQSESERERRLQTLLDAISKT